MYYINQRPITSYIWVGLQFLSIGLLLYLGPILAGNIYGLLSQAISLLLASWAILEMRKSRISVLPDLQTDATLVTSGPYKLIRHPMYTSLLLMFAPITIEQPSLIKYLIFSILILVITLKAKYEETQLAKRFNQFAAYRKTSYIIIPFIW